MSGRGDKEFSKKETAQRFEAALRGALSTSPKPLKDIPKTRSTEKPKGKRRKAAKRHAG